MRLIYLGLLLLFCFALLGFGISNPQTVSVTLWNRQFVDIHLTMVVFIAAAFGVVVTMIVALIEGATIRLANRRLNRELHRMDTELHFLRREPAAASDPAPKAVVADAPAGDRPIDRPLTDAPPSAPVYGADAENTPDLDDDAYSGGRAV